ncbi:MAG: fimbrial protein FimV, partial [Rhodoferax sp.]
MSPSVLALSLGRITVQSALGEPLRAEVDIPEINAEEAASLKAVVAQPSVFQAAGLEYNPAMANVKASLQTRANGRAFIRLSSDRAINEPFVDMILEATWASGRIVRDYTMLFDPVTLKKPEPIASGAVQAPSQTQAPSA